MNVTLGEPTLVAQAEEPGLAWGIWQFPMIARTALNELAVFFSQTIDDASASAKVRPPAGCYRSQDGGKTWAPSSFFQSSSLGYKPICELRNGDRIFLVAPGSQDIPRVELPPPEGFCDHGYGGCYSVRDPLKIDPALQGRWQLARLPAGEPQWSYTPVTIDDPDGGVIGFDSPGKDYATIHWGETTHMHLLELPDGRLLEIRYGYRLNRDRTPRPKWECWSLVSGDGGLTWTFHGTLGRDDQHGNAGFTEPSACLLPDGSLMAVLRTESGVPGALFLTHSTDTGRTWSTPRQVHPFGVLPQLLVLKNSTVILSFGRPGVQLLFCRDGLGKAWNEYTTLVYEDGTVVDGFTGSGVGFQRGEVQKGRPKQTCTCGYTGLLATGPDRFLITYSLFHHPDVSGKPRKAIMVREVVVTL